MYTRNDITMDDRMEIFSRYWRFSDDHGIVSQLSEEFGISRNFIYSIASKVGQALDWRKAGRPEADRSQQEIDKLQKRVRALEADCAQLEGQIENDRKWLEESRFGLLLELALCPVSEDNIVRCLQAAFGSYGDVSSGWVHQQIERAGQAALNIMQSEEVENTVQAMALDEIFRHRQPILTAIDPHTLMAFIPEPAENRKGETWMNLLDRYPRLNFVVSDQGSGLLKGVKDSARDIAHQYDLFHFKRECATRSRLSNCNTVTDVT